MSEPMKNDGASEFTPIVYQPVDPEEIRKELDQYDRDSLIAFFGVPPACIKDDPEPGGFSFGTSWFGGPVKDDLKPEPKAETWRDRPPLL